MSSNSLEKFWCWNSNMKYFDITLVNIHWNPIKRRCRKPYHIKDGALNDISERLEALNYCLKELHLWCRSVLTTTSGLLFIFRFFSDFFLWVANIQQGKQKYIRIVLFCRFTNKVKFNIIVLILFICYIMEAYILK